MSGPCGRHLLAHFGEIAQDVVIAGHDRDDMRVLVFPNLDACRRPRGTEPGASVRDTVDRRGSAARFAAALAAFASTHAGSSMRVERAMLLVDLPSIDGSELTDKGSLNQKAVLRRRAALVEAAVLARPATSC